MLRLASTILLRSLEILKNGRQSGANGDSTWTTIPCFYFSSILPFIFTHRRILYHTGRLHLVQPFREFQHIANLEQSAYEICDESLSDLLDLLKSCDYLLNGVLPVGAGLYKNEKFVQALQMCGFKATFSRFKVLGVTTCNRVIYAFAISKEK